MHYGSTTRRVGLIGGGADLLEQELRRLSEIPVSRIGEGSAVPPLTAVAVVEKFEPGELWRHWEAREVRLWGDLEAALGKLSNPARILVVGLTDDGPDEYRKDVRSYLEYLIGETKGIAVNAYGLDIAVNALEAPRSVDVREIALSVIRYAGRRGLGGDGIVVKYEALRGASIGAYLSGFDV
ncbi:hypothetical protein [Dietzia aurantiaca]|uniref:Uncharacterized protein n=1 Tax=Dietzia aurantiaca TaxID=983873 RepID=A0ABV9PPN6_9ACTN